MLCTSTTFGFCIHNPHKASLSSTCQKVKEKKFSDSLRPEREVCPCAFCTIFHPDPAPLAVTSPPSPTAMSYVDRSNTEWAPRYLQGVPKRFAVVGGVLAIAGTAAVLNSIRRSVAPPPPSTMTKEWKDATVKSLEAKEREAAGPVVVNPIARSREQ